MLFCHNFHCEELGEEHKQSSCEVAQKYAGFDSSSIFCSFSFLLHRDLIVFATFFTPNKVVSYEMLSMSLLLPAEFGNKFNFLMQVVDKTRKPTTSKNWPFLLTLFTHVE